jgi:hypothetical protein
MDSNSNESKAVIIFSKMPIQEKTIVVPVHGNKDLPKGIYHAILKQAGIDKDQIK